jgi:hypothetical protein
VILDGSHPPRIGSRLGADEVNASPQAGGELLDTAGCQLGEDQGADDRDRDQTAAELDRNRKQVVRVPVAGDTLAGS